MRTSYRLAGAAGAVALTAALTAATALGSPAAVSSTTFHLFPNPTTLACVAPTGQTPTVTATVTRGHLNDHLALSLSHFKPHLSFDLFTVQRSNQQANGQPVSGFTSFGLAWYQSDVQTDASGSGSVSVNTILLDQIFGFDPDTGLAPTNTFHVGFWFNTPAEAAPCGFTGPPTPFNGEHDAGPVAFITRPDATTGLGPLCTAPVKSGSTFSCHP